MAHPSILNNICLLGVALLASGQSSRDSVCRRGRGKSAEGGQLLAVFSDITLPTLLKQAGYITIHVGKAHFAPFDHEGAEPLNLGFGVIVAGSES